MSGSQPEQAFVKDDLPFTVLKCPLGAGCEYRETVVESHNVNAAFVRNPSPTEDGCH